MFKANGYSAVAQFTNGGHNNRLPRINIFDCDFVFIPVHRPEGGGHWVLIVVNISNLSLTHYDPLTRPTTGVCMTHLTVLDISLTPSSMTMAGCCKHDQTRIFRTFLASSFSPLTSSPCSKQTVTLPWRSSQMEVTITVCRESTFSIATSFSFQFTVPKEADTGCLLSSTSAICHLLITIH